MARTLFLHIGTGKTGSSTIQHLLSQNRAALLSQGVCYPGKGVNHLLFTMNFTSLNMLDGFDMPLWSGKEPAEVIATNMAALREEILTLPPTVTKVIMSSEQLSQFVRDVTDIERIRDALVDLVDDIRIIVYLRRQDAYVASFYSQALRKGVIRRPGFKRWREGGQRAEYDKILTDWASVFGEAAIRPRIFERDTDKSFDVVADFVQQTGIPPLVAREEAVKNPSMNLSGQRILRDIGRSMKEEDPAKFARTMVWKRLTGFVTGALTGTGWKPTQAEAKLFMEKFADANESIRRRWFPERTTLFSTDYSHLPVDPMVSSIESDLQASYDVILHIIRDGIARDHGVTDYAKLKRPALMKAIRIDPTNAEARLHLAAVQIREGSNKAARHNLEAVLAQDSGHERAQEMLESLGPDEDAGDPAPVRLNRRGEPRRGQKGAEAGRQGGG